MFSQVSESTLLKPDSQLSKHLHKNSIHDFYRQKIIKVILNGGFLKKIQRKSFIFHRLLIYYLY